ncbi:MAG: HAD family hydrolase [Candidatus Omnitrophica bacterium]|nr:HAD family hydrolase [Candidatus Omnitrophota bacterium]
MRKKGLIIFDLDGTLVDAYPAITASFNHTMKETGYPRQKANLIRSSVGWGDRNLLKPFLEKKDLDEALLIYRRHHAKALLSGSRLFPQTLKVLAYLKNEGYKLAVASNRPTRFARILIRRLKLDKYLDYVLCGDKLKHMKPHPEILNKIMCKFRIKPDRTVYVGDMFIDAQTGRRAKVKTIMLTTGSSTREELQKEKPYRIINRLTQLTKLV